MTPKELLISGADELGIKLTPEQVNAFFLFIAELAKWNRKINLTAIHNERDVVIKHVLDSLTYLRKFPATSELRLLDMGSGAGFPAIPVKIVLPGIAVMLVESVKKKAAFLRHAIRLLNLTAIEVLDQRTEELAQSYNAAFDVVTARAFADMESALVAGRRFLKTGGCMVLSRGPDETLSKHGVERLGFVMAKHEELTLPHSDYRRALWVFSKKA